MMKLAAFVLSYREYRLGCERLLIIKFALLFGADLVNALAFSEVRSIPLFIVKVLALCRNLGGTAEFYPVLFI